MFPDDLPTFLLKNTKGVPVGNFRDLRFSCLHSLDNNSVLTHGFYFCDAEVDFVLATLK